MTLRISSFIFCVLAVSWTQSSAFVPTIQNGANSIVLQMATSPSDKVEAAIQSQLKYKGVRANTEFARRFGHLAGKKIKTVGESFADFTRILGFTINPLYKGMITDIVGSLHLIVVNARFQRDPVWCLGIVKALDLLLKNYPEPDVRELIESAMFQAVGLNEAEVRADAVKAQEWVSNMSRAEVETALLGEGDSPLAAMVRGIQDEQFWMYSRFFGIGLLQIMETVGIPMDKDEIYPIMEDWMSNRLKKSHLTACNDSDLYFKIREKLDMMETMMKEIEIREKKRMAERLEAKAEEALRAAEREALMQKEIELEAAKNRERVGAS